MLSGAQQSLEPTCLFGDNLLGEHARSQRVFLKYRNPLKEPLERIGLFRKDSANDVASVELFLATLLCLRLLHELLQGRLHL